MEEKVVVKSMTNGKIGVTIPDLKIRKNWPRKGSTVTFKKEELQEAMFDPGFEYMLKTGILYIEDMEVKKELELEPKDVKEPQNIVVFNDAQMKRLCTVAPLKDFKEAVAKVSVEQVRALATYAIENNMMDFDKAEVIKKACGKDVISAVMLKRKNEEKVD